MNDELFKQLLENREKLKKLDGNYNNIDYKPNEEINEQFLELLNGIDIKKSNNKAVLFRNIGLLAKKTVDKTLYKTRNLPNNTDLEWGHYLRINVLYLNDSINKLIEAIKENNPVLVKFYGTQAESTRQELEKHPWGKDASNKIIERTEYQTYKKIGNKMLNKIPWSLIYNEEFRTNKEKIFNALEKDPNEIYNIDNNYRQDKKFMLEVLESYPECYYGIEDKFKKDKDIAELIIDKNYIMFCDFGDESLKKDKNFISKVLDKYNDIKEKKFFLASCGYTEEQIDNFLNKQKKDLNKQRFDGSKFNNNSFLSELNKCQNTNEVIKLVDKTVKMLEVKGPKPDIIGSSGDMFANSAYSNNGIFNGFIYPQTKISNATTGFSYHIYDNDYLYSFALWIRKMNLPQNANLFTYVLPFLDSYFGLPKDNIDRRDDVLYRFAVNNADKFYKEHNIPIYSGMSAVDQMQMSGDFPISALRGQNAAQCVERGTLAQNILKLCGYKSLVMFGEAESDGKREGHCWNAILDNHNNAMLIDYSNTATVYDENQKSRRTPYYCNVSFDNLTNSINQDDIIKGIDYYYKNGQKVYKKSQRKYAIGRNIELDKQITNDEHKSK